MSDADVDVTGTASFTAATDGTITLSTDAAAPTGGITFNSETETITLPGVEGAIYTLAFSGPTLLSVTAKPSPPGTTISPEGKNISVRITGPITTKVSDNFFVNTITGPHDPSIAIDPPPPQ